MGGGVRHGLVRFIQSEGRDVELIQLEETGADEPDQAGPQHPAPAAGGTSWRGMPP
jgi:hypothetical protein